MQHTNPFQMCNDRKERGQTFDKLYRLKDYDAYEIRCSSSSSTINISIKIQGRRPKLRAALIISKWNEMILIVEVLKTLIISHLTIVYNNITVKRWERKLYFKNIGTGDEWAIVAVAAHSYCIRYRLSLPLSLLLCLRIM